MQGVLAGWWRALLMRPGIVLPAVLRGLSHPRAVFILFGLLGAASLAGLSAGDARFSLLTLASLASYVLLRKDAGRGFLLLGLSCALSPKVPLPLTGASFIFLRLDDLLTVLLCMRMAGMRGKKNPLTGALAMFLLLAGLSLLAGIWSHSIDQPFYSFFNFLKWAQYFLLFVLAYQWPQPLDAAKQFAAGIAASMVFLLPFGFWEHFHPLNPTVIGSFYRLFERPPFLAQANHYGMLFALMLCALLPWFDVVRRPSMRIALLGPCVAVVTVLTWTYSRTAYLALAAGFAVICALGRNRVFFAVSACLLLMPLFFSARALERTVSIQQSMHGTRFSSSAVSRFAIWQETLPEIVKHPLLGTGIGSRNRVYYDSFYVQLLAETGFLGAAVYLLGLLGRGAARIFNAYRRQGEGEGGALALGALGMLAAMGVGGITLVDFVITMLAIPFWIFFGLGLRWSQDACRA